MAIPFKYTIRSFMNRKLTTIITIAGIGLVVFVFAAVLMMAYGVEKTLVSTGSPDNIKVVRKSSQGEISSIIEGETVNLLKTLPHILIMLNRAMWFLKAHKSELWVRPAGQPEPIYILK